MPPSRLQSVLTALQNEESVLQSQIGKVRDAIAALRGLAGDYQRRQHVRKAKIVTRNVRKMTAAQRKAISERMKKRWAAAKRAGKKTL